MKLLFDLLHPAHINFFKHLIRRLRSEGHEILLVCLNRGKVPQILASELPGFAVRPIGCYARTRLGLYFRTGLLRELALARLVLSAKPDVSVGVAAFQTGALSRLFGFKSLGVHDDPEYKLAFRLCRRFLHRLVVPACLGVSGPNIVPFRGLKEWAYLSPAYFRPDEGALARHGLKPEEYIFVRDVDTSSLNYRNQVVNNIELLYKKGLCDAKVVLSLENKAIRERYTQWQILEEPVGDIHSLMYYSKLVISSGDSMAREGTQLGVPAIYCGQRLMRANQLLVELGFLHHVTEPESILQGLAAGAFDVSADEQRARRQRLLEQWDDPNETVYRALMELAGDKGP
ncbi:MAG TPA: DUF354 domain-containing protein [Planctomycetota bacterium]|nr:DUF354 domain-containing protein [Planctomycetota bacterium]